MPARGAGGSRSTGEGCRPLARACSLGPILTPRSPAASRGAPALSPSPAASVVRRLRRRAASARGGGRLRAGRAVGRPGGGRVVVLPEALDLAVAHGEDVYELDLVDQAAGADAPRVAAEDDDLVALRDELRGLETLDRLRAAERGEEPADALAPVVLSRERHDVAGAGDRPAHVLREQSEHGGGVGPGEGRGCLFKRLHVLLLGHHVHSFFKLKVCCEACEAANSSFAPAPAS